MLQVMADGYGTKQDVVYAPSILFCAELFHKMQAL